MRLLRVRKKLASGLRLFCPVRVQVVAYIFALALGLAQEPPVIDLTGDDPGERAKGGSPGISAGVGRGAPFPGARYGGGLGIKAVQPKLPLQLEILSLQPEAVSLFEQFTVEVLVRNTGSVSFDVPTSRDFRRVMQQGNRGRRSLLISMGVKAPGEQEWKTTIAASAQGSASVPNSLIRLAPGGAVRIRFAGMLRLIDGLSFAEPATARVRFALSEWKLDEQEFVTTQISEQVESANEITIRVETKNP